jgi:hypothetical protein
MSEVNKQQDVSSKYIWLSDPEEGDNTFLRNIRELESNYKALYPRKQYS